MAGPAEPVRYDFGDMSRWGGKSDANSAETGGARQGGEIHGNTNMTNEQILAETDRVQQDMLKSTQRALQELHGAEEAGTAALEGLARQNEQIDNIVANLDKMRTDIAYSDMVLKKIASPFAFLYLKKETEEFATVFGSPPHWSGPMLKKGNFLTGYATRYFALVHSRLIYFASEKNVWKGDLRSPRGEMCIKGAQVESNRPKLEITLRSGSEKWQLRCETQNDFAGWLTMLERHASGKFAATPGSNKESSDKSATAPPVAPASVGQQKAALFSQEQPVGQPKTIDAQVDDNLDLMMQKLDLLGGIACEQKQAIDHQNAKLDAVADAMDLTNNSLSTLQDKHKQRLKDASS